MCYDCMFTFALYTHTITNRIKFDITGQTCNVAIIYKRLQHEHDFNLLAARYTVVQTDRVVANDFILKCPIEIRSLQNDQHTKQRICMST